MLFVPFFLFINTKNFDQIPSLILNDFKTDSTFFIYIYYNKPNLDCPLCKLFNDKISEIPMTIKKINFYESPYIASHLYQSIFPSFVVRHNRRSYVLNVTEVDELFNIIEEDKWKSIVPIHWLLETDSIITKIYSFLFSIFYFSVEYVSEYIENIPHWAVNAIMSFIIGYLVISIIGIFNVNK
jgi:hypothetical protein